MATQIKDKRNNTLVGLFKKKIPGNPWLPIFLFCTVLAILFVLFRMKVVEIDYKTTEIIHEIDKIKLEQKEIEAQKAKLLSIKNLRDMAKKHNMKQPQRNQIIVIPSDEANGI